MILIVGNFVFVVVRDLKTDNIFLMKDSMVKIGDFGISKLLSTASPGANTVLGTPYYISPEMVSNVYLYRGYLISL